MGSTFDFLDCLLGRARFRIRLAGARRLAGDVLVGHAGKYRPEVCSSHGQAESRPTWADLGIKSFIGY